MPYPQITNGYLEYDTSGFPVVGGSQDNVIEDFEDQSLSEYGDATNWQIQGSNVLQGRYSLEVTGDYGSLGDDGGDFPTPRHDPPIEYRCRMLQPSGGWASFMVNVQAETSPWRNAYGVLVDTDATELALHRTEGGDHQRIATSTGGTHPNAGTEYIAGITTSTEAVKASLYDRSGTLIEETASIADQTHTGGGIGWDNGPGGPVYFDQVTRGPGSHGEIQGARTWIEDFEDGGIGEYTAVNNVGQASAAPSAAYGGDYGLELIDGVDLQSTPGSGLENYLRSGQEVVFRVNFQTIQSSDGLYQQYWVPFCMQDETSDANRYRLEFLMNGGFRIRKTVSGSSNTVPGTSSEDRDYAALYNVSHSTGSWYSAILLVDESNGLYAELHDASGNIKGWVSSSETEYVGPENGIGWRSSGTGHVYFDHMHDVDQQYLDAEGRSEPIPHSNAPW